MDFLQKIYYNDKTLILTTDSEAYISGNETAEAYSFFSGATLRNFTQALQHLDRPGINGAIIEDASQESLQEQLYALFRPIEAGGGVVYNEQNEILMIYRRGKWDLPKGKLDEGENIKECALREVREETGLEHVQGGDKICDTYHIYSQHNEQLLKCTAWYKMTGTIADALKPQKEENILEARWISEAELAPFIAKTYDAIKDVLKAAGVKW